MDNRLSITAITTAAESAPLVLRGDLAENIAAAKKLGYDAVEIHVIDASDFPTADVRKACLDNDIRISSIVTGRIFTERGRCFTSPDPENRDAAMRELYAYIDLTAELQAADGIIIGWVKGNRRDDPGFDELLAEQLRKLGLYGQEKGVRILVEVINRYETNLFNTAEELVTFLKKWDLPNCFVHLDTFHMNIEEADEAEAIRTAGDLLGYFHVADSNRRTPGRGHIDFVKQFRALKEVGYTGSISLECIPDPDRLLTGAEGYDYLKKAIAEADA